MKRFNMTGSFLLVAVLAVFAFGCDDGDDDDGGSGGGGAGGGGAGGGGAGGDGGAGGGGAGGGGAGGGGAGGDGGAGGGGAGGDGGAGGGGAGGGGAGGGGAGGGGAGGGGAGGAGGAEPEGAQIDRMGRPAVSTALVPADRKDDYNQDTDVAGWAGTWSPVFEASLNAVDALNGTAGDTLLPPAAVAPALAQDWLVLDTSKPFSPAGYLHRELVLVGLLPDGASSSGGRWMGQNVVDITLDALVGGFALNELGMTEWDCVPSNDAEFTMTFPFLAVPN